MPSWSPFDFDGYAPAVAPQVAIYPPMIWSTVFGSSVKISVEMELEEGPDWITFFILVRVFSANFRDLVVLFFSSAVLRDPLPLKKRMCPFYLDFHRKQEP
jgi:hypothetical protein